MCFAAPWPRQYVHKICCMCHSYDVAINFLSYFRTSRYTRSLDIFLWKLSEQVISQPKSNILSYTTWSSDLIFCQSLNQGWLVYFINCSHIILFSLCCLWRSGPGLWPTPQGPTSAVNPSGAGSSRDWQKNQINFISSWQQAWLIDHDRDIQLSMMTSNITLYIIQHISQQE